MKKWNICKLLALQILSTLNNNDAAAQGLTLLQTTHLPHYPSASTLAYTNNRLYVVGDDATYLLVLNKNHQLVDSLRLFKGTEKRIGKEEKADLEASIITQKGKETFLLLFSSFSDKNRNKVLQLPISEEKLQKEFETFSEVNNAADLNIEGAAFIDGNIVLSNRANQVQKQNSLLVLKGNSGKDFSLKGARNISIQLPVTRHVVGISGLDYIPEKDLLLFTASTEITDNAIDDGEIGDSYLGYITNVSRKLQQSTLKADKLENLKSVLLQKGAQKIESVAVEAVNGNSVILHLAADNDNGESTLFKLRLPLPTK